MTSSATTCGSAAPAAAKFGTYFIGCARTPDLSARMLRNSFLGTAGTSRDRILGSSTPVTVTLFFTPSADFLDDMPALSRVPAATTSPESIALPGPPTAVSASAI
ncbi:Dyp-type peroxidase domain-containing protein [Actinacidiphila guanduensis]|uniref:Dyp-type peroxidase domain-containing protein n=1 Tax=Actinacidiphila guanduensis TaxID=310781 RepID=UPI00115FDEDB